MSAGFNLMAEQTFEMGVNGQPEVISLGGLTIGCAANNPTSESTAQIVQGCDM